MPPAPTTVDPELFYAIFAYAGFGTISTIFLGKALVGQQAQQVIHTSPLILPLAVFLPCSA